MLHFTPNFHHVFGPCGLGEDFLPWVKRNQSEQFVSWIQTSWLSLSEGDVSIEIFPRSLLFLPTQLRQHRLAFLATVFLDQASCPAETEPSRTTVRLTFSNVRRVTAGAGGRRSRRRSRTPGVAADGQDGHFHLSI
ncbi:unnamed protein product [Prorocentrum cordatum]|uniref:FACT complex subunit n=1 Tax=Prorocentrum cordatum TaxID=2364126 RepID=A0ABN9RJH1_9DINO|nr:unnamed protein product [Polarella glacialis]